MTGKESYAYENKRQWRREVWDAVAKRVSNPSTARVVYLAGPENFDAWEALKRGFKSQNMIAVERDSEAAKVLRKNIDQPVVGGDFWDVVMALAITEKVDVVIADFISGLTDSILFKGAAAMTMPNLQGAVVAMNLQRGRENPKHKHAYSLVKQRKLEDWDEHRGKLALFGMANLHAHYLCEQNNWAFEEQVRLVDQQFFDWWRESARGSYKSESGRLTFDTVIFQNRSLCQSGAVTVDQWKRELSNSLRAIAAARAVRTARGRRYVSGLH